MRGISTLIYFLKTIGAHWKLPINLFHHWSSANSLETTAVGNSGRHVCDQIKGMLLLPMPSSSSHHSCLNRSSWFRKTFLFSFYGFISFSFRWEVEGTNEGAASSPRFLDRNLRFRLPDLPLWFQWASLCKLFLIFFLYSGCDKVLERKLSWSYIKLQGLDGRSARIYGNDRSVSFWLGFVDLRACTVDFSIKDRVFKLNISP